MFVVRAFTLLHSILISIFHSHSINTTDSPSNRNTTVRNLMQKTSRATRCSANSSKTGHERVLQTSQWILCWKVIPQSSSYSQQDAIIVCGCFSGIVLYSSLHHAQLYFSLPKASFIQQQQHQQQQQQLLYDGVLTNKSHGKHVSIH